MNNNIVLTFVFLSLFDLVIAGLTLLNNNTTEAILDAKMSYEVTNMKIEEAAYLEDKFIEGSQRDQAQELLPPIDSNPGLIDLTKRIKEGIKDDTRINGNEIEQGIFKYYWWIIGIVNTTCFAWVAILAYTRDHRK